MQQTARENLGRSVPGLSMPMAMGSPGMEMPGRKPQSYKVYSIDRRGKAHLVASH